MAKAATTLYFFSVDRNDQAVINCGSLDAGQFVKGSQALDADDRIIYNPETGALMFDMDGSGAGAAVQFATLQTGLSITAADFMVI